MATPSEDAMQTRILNHMNKDHADSVQRYLEHYCKAPRTTSRSATLTEVSLDKMVIQAAGRAYPIPLDPPMTSLGQFRERAVAMDRETVTALKRSTITIKQYRFPKGVPLVIAIACFTAYTVYSRAAFTAPGSRLYQLLPFGLGKLVHASRWPTLVFLVSVHGFELTLMAKKLEKHSVPLFSDVWIKWMFNTFIEGFTTFQRFNAMVAREEKKKAQQKH